MSGGSWSHGSGWSSGDEEAKRIPIGNYQQVETSLKPRE